MIDPALGLEEVMPLSERFLVSLAAFLESRVSPSVEAIRPVGQSSVGGVLEGARLEGQGLEVARLNGEGLELGLELGQKPGQVQGVLAVPETGNGFMPETGNGFMPETGNGFMPETITSAEAAMMMADCK